MLEEFYLPDLRRRAQKQGSKIQIRTQWFQQDRAPPHTARAAREFLRKHFPGRLISLYKYVEWPQYSPDLAPPDFFLWGYLKDQMYENLKPRNIEQRKANIQRKILKIAREISKRHERCSSTDLDSYWTTGRLY